MLGDFRYCSSSESSDGDSDSDTSTKSEDYLEKLITEKKLLEEKIRDREERLKVIQNTLKSLNDERKKLFAKRNALITSWSQAGESGPGDVPRRTDSNEHMLPSTSKEPLNLDPQIQANENEEEFDSDIEV